MDNLKIEALYIYPLKSAQGILINKTEVLKTGFKSDRLFGIINTDNVLLTAREKPRLLHLEVSFLDSVLLITVPGKDPCSVDLNKVATKSIQVSLFKDVIAAKLIARVANEYLSDFLKEQVRLISIDSNSLRKVKEKYSAAPNDEITFSDVAPIHLVNEASVTDLNYKLAQPILSTRFRPNMVISGVKAFEEETWKFIKIGECEFEVITATKRCSLITIDPVRLQRHPKQEPLRTLSENKKESINVNFGVYLVPRKLGEISVNDTLEVLS